MLPTENPGQHQPQEKSSESRMSLLSYLKLREHDAPSFFGRKASGSKYDQVNETLILTQLALCVDTVSRRYQ